MYPLCPAGLINQCRRNLFDVVMNECYSDVPDHKYSLIIAEYVHHHSDQKKKRESLGTEEVSWTGFDLCFNFMLKFSSCAVCEALNNTARRTEYLSVLWV